MQFALFIGAAMSVTAFPVLMRILVDRGMEASELGGLALACAALNDVVSWAVVAVLAAAVGSGAGRGPVAAVGSVALLVVVAVAARRLLLPRVNAALGRRGRAHAVGVAASLATLAGFSLLAGAAGADPVIGAFVLGAVWPRRAASPSAPAIGERLLPLMLPLLPLAFVAPGLAAAASDAVAPSLALLVFAVATLAKLSGVTVAARLTGTPPRQALARGVLMNTRGLMELVVLNIGLPVAPVGDRPGGANWARHPNVRLGAGS